MSEVWDHSGAVQRWKHLHWQQRHLGLRGQQLHYFKDPRDRIPELIVDLHGAQVTVADPLVLFLRPKGGAGETLKLRLATPADRQEWLRRLTDAVQGARPGLDAEGPPLLPSVGSRARVSSYLKGLSTGGGGAMRRGSHHGDAGDGGATPRSARRHTTAGDWGGSPSDGLFGRPEGPHRPESEPPSRTTSTDSVVAPPTSPEYRPPQSFVQPAELVGWKRGAELGRGSFGQVWLGLLTNGKFVAVKEIEFGAGAEDTAIAAEIKTELDLMRKLSHPHIVRCFGTNYQDRRLSIFLEYVPQGALAKVIRMFGPLQYVTALAYTQQIVTGLVYLHANNVIHRDIKCDNVLLDTNGTVKLSDFGCAKELARNCDSTSTVVGTPNFIAPEVIIHGTYNAKADVWSLGCTCVEMITGLPPWPEFSTVWAALNHIAESEGPPGLPDDLDPRFHRLLLQCFERDVARRPSSADLARLPIMRRGNPELIAPELASTA